MFGSLRLRLYLSYLLVILLTLGLAGLAFSLLLRGYRERLAVGTLREVVRPVQFLVEGNPGRLRGMLGAIQLEARSSDVVLWFLGADGRIVIDGSADQRYLNQTLAVPLDSFRRPRDIYQGTVRTADGQEWLIVASPVSRPSVRQQLGVVAVAAAIPKSAIGGPLQDITPYLLGAGGVGFVAALLTGFLLSRSLSRPLERMTEAASRVAAGDYAVQVPVEGPVEARRLAVSFNQMTAAVRRSQQTLRDFLANVSHELKTPLTAIRGFAQAMVDGTLADREGLERAARVIEAESRRVLHLVQEILDLSRLEAGQTQMLRSAVDVGELLRHVAEVFSLRAEESGVRLEVQADGAGAVRGDFDRLEQVFGNLLDNAFRHTPAGGLVRLTARPLTDGRVEIAVADSGEGMPPEALSHIFDRFYQVNGSPRRGTGLGLAISREIVHAHGGEIRAESIQGVGTRFIVTLPAADAA